MAHMSLDELVSQLAKVYGADLRAVVLYGSAARGEHIARRSDVNVLVIADSLTMAHLREEAAVARAWAESGNPPPLTMTTAEWRGSADIFPMEYADVLERHQVLHGTLPLDGVAVSPHDLRLQVEQEAMGKLLRLRREILAAGGDRKRLADLISRSLSAVMVVFRGVERLNGAAPSVDYEALSRAVAARAGFDAEPFVRAVHHARGSVPLSGEAVERVVGGYLAGLEHLVAYLDRFVLPS
jgi:hypothetical protein